MPRPHLHVFLLLAVLSLFWSGCGGFNGVLAPTLTSINPTTVAAGGADFTLTANGTNFAPGSAILWDGTSLPTTVGSSTQLTAKVTANQIANAGTVSIRVMKSDSTTSGTLNLTITGGSGGGSFSLTSISPPAVAAGSTSFTLTAIGVGFVSGAAITLNGTAVATTFDSATQLHATVPAADVASAGTVTVGVTNPDKSTTNTLPLTVVAGGGLGPAPTLTSLSPNTSPNAITTALTLTATGTNFVSGSKVMWNGVAMTTTFVSSTQLTASIPTTYINVPASAFDPATSTATAEVYVLNPDSTVSNELPFTITVSASVTPVLKSIYNSVDGTSHSNVNDPGFTLTLCGSLFAANAVAYFGATPLQSAAVTAGGTTCETSQQFTAQVPASQLTAVSEVQVTVKNPSSAASNPIPYYVGMNIYFDESADVVWDSRNNLLYVSKPTTAHNNGDTVMAFSPRLGLTDKAAIWIYPLSSGSNPDKLALSGDGKYLYVGLDGTGVVQQLAITSASAKPTPGNVISLGKDPQFGPYYAVDLQVSPTNSGTIAVARGVSAATSTLTALGGVVIYDGITPRTNTVGWSQSNPLLLDTLQWSVDGSTIYAANNEKDAGDLYQLTVSNSGVALASDTQGVFVNPNLYIHLSGANLYGDDGVIVNPSNVALKSNFPVGTGVIVPDTNTGNAYFLGQPASAFGTIAFTLQAFNLTTQNEVASLDLFNVQGIPQHMVEWHLTNLTPALDGLAFTTKRLTNCNVSPCLVGDGRLYVIDLPF